MSNHLLTFEECVPALIIGHGFKGEDAVRTIRGIQVWDAARGATRRSLKRTMEKNGFPFRIENTTHQLNVLILGRDRVTISRWFHHRNSGTGEISGAERNVLMGRLAKGEWPDPNCDLEQAQELDYILQGPPSFGTIPE